MFGFLPDTLFLALLTSTLLAGLRRATGLTLQAQQLVPANNAAGAQFVGLYLSGGEWAFGRLAAYAKGSKYFKYDPDVTVAQVRSQVGGFADGIKAAAALAGEFASSSSHHASSAAAGSGGVGGADGGVKKDD